MKEDLSTKDTKSHEGLATFRHPIIPSCLFVSFVDILCLAFMLIGCADEPGAATNASARTVVVFTAHDRIYSEPILKAFEQETGIRVQGVYDAEAAKTTGLINRLLARRGNPECDVLWNNEIMQTESLAQQGLLATYESCFAAERIPEQFRDPEGRWTGFAARLRVLVYNKNSFKDAAPPATLTAFSDPAYRGQGVIALPYFGTTFTHVGVLHERWGAARLREWLERAKANDTAFAPGNGSACQLVASGERSFGLTDTDDAYGAILDGKPIGVLIPDPSEGAVLIPNTVALIHGAPHPAEGKALIDYLLSAKVERQLAEMRSAQIPLGKDLRELETPWSTLLRDAPPRELPVRKIAHAREELIALLRDAGIR